MKYGHRPHPSFGHPPPAAADRMTVLPGWLESGGQHPLRPSGTSPVTQGRDGFDRLCLAYKPFSGAFQPFLKKGHPASPVAGGGIARPEFHESLNCFSDHLSYITPADLRSSGKTHPVSAAGGLLPNE